MATRPRIALQSGRNEGGPRMRVEGIVGGLVIASVAAGVMLAPSAVGNAANTGKRCDRCQDLPTLEKEVFEQEFLADLFRQYWTGKKPIPSPKCKDQTPTDAMVNEATDAFNQYLRGPAGGNRSAKNMKGDPCKQNVQNPCAGNATTFSTVPFETDFGSKDCDIVANEATCVKGKPVVNKHKITDKDGQDFISKTYCSQVSDYLIAHESQHKKDCQNGADIGEAHNYAMSDAKAYLAGVRSLRHYIAQKAKDCGWQGSSDDTKKGPDDEPMDVMPTMKEAKNLAKSLGGAK